MLPKHISGLCGIQAASRLIGGPSLPKLRCHGNKGRPRNILYGFIESAIPENPLVGPNISGVFAVQADLEAILCQILGVRGLNQKAKNNVL